ncbi:S8 family serine peptidase [Rosettibacter firmus]|uniref:S8 family serine peptidase n=1 Tax=Rosettibacter firmus TaxID=3111522 RepID=UPI00336C10A5
MKISYSIIFFIIFFISVPAQNKYFIYFKDKGFSESQLLKKNSQVFIQAEKELSTKAIERRKKVLGNNYITIEDIPVNEEYIQQIEKLGVKIIHKLKWFNAVSCYLNEEHIISIKKLPFVKSIEKVKSIVSIKPVDLYENYSVVDLRKTDYSLKYGYSQKQNLLSEIPAVHDLGINGSGVLIGLLDTGFRWKNHPAFRNITVIGEKDFIQNDNSTANDTSKGDSPNQDKHGTAVLSIIAGYDEGNLIGPAYGASFLLAKTEYVPTETHIEEDNYAAALEWMEAQGVDITSSSIGYNTFDAGENSYTFLDMNGKTTIVAQAANLAFERGVSTFTAAGNEGNSDWGAKYGDNKYGKIVSPADAFNMIAVGAVDTNNLVTSFSSRGPTADGRIKPDIVAQGSRVYFALADGGYAYGSGTSYATPIAAGIAALLKSAYPHLNNYQIRQIILESGDNANSPDNHRGYGLISARRAISFPNLEKINNQFILYKIFIDSTQIKSEPVYINYKIDNSNYYSYTLNYDGKLKYSFNIPNLRYGQKISFYFSYKNESGEVRDPQSGLYEFYYGSMLIHYNVYSVEDTTDFKKEIIFDYYLYNNYPNPFNGSTRIEFYSVDNSYAELSVYDLLGQKIKTIFSGNSQIGRNVLYWKGDNDSGMNVSSGHYFYVLKINGKYFSKKMTLIK